MSRPAAFAKYNTRLESESLLQLRLQPLYFPTLISSIQQLHTQSLVGPINDICNQMIMLITLSGGVNPGVEAPPAVANAVVAPLNPLNTTTTTH